MTPSGIPVTKLPLARVISEPDIGVFGRPIEVSPETIRMDDILDIGFGLDKSYFSTDYTLLNFKEHLWCPELLDRSGWEGVKTDEAVLQKLQERVKSLIASYRKPEVDPDKLAKMRKVVDRAKKELLS